MPDLEANKKEIKRNKKRDFCIQFVVKLTILCLLFYFFVVALDFFRHGVELVTGRIIFKLHKFGSILENKVAALVLGILISVFIQSPTSSSTIVTALVAAQALSVKTAIPIVMGTNVGSTIISTIVAFSQFNHSHRFQKAFSDAVLHDIFNMLSALVLLPIEYLTSYLERFSSLLDDLMIGLGNEGMKIDFLYLITKPFVKLIIQFDTKVFEIIKTRNITLEELATMDEWPLIKKDCGESEYAKKDCLYLFSLFESWPEYLIGLVLILLSLFILTLCLLGLKRVLSSIFDEETFKSTQDCLNSSLPGCFKYLTSIMFILIGMLLTILIQSSSVFTSMLTLLVGLGLLSIERVFPMIIGSNIGITINGLVIALGGKTNTLRYELQIALSHFIFNITGAIIWLPLPFMRRIPIRLAKGVGKTSAKYRWFSIVYVFTFFIVIPILILVLSFAGQVVFFSIFLPILFLVFVIILINVIQTKWPNLLPKSLQTWEFLPECLRSLEPYDEMFMNLKSFFTNDQRSLFYIDQRNSDDVEENFLLEKSKLYDVNKLTL